MVTTKPAPPPAPLAAIAPERLRRLEPMAAFSDERLLELAGYCRVERYPPRSEIAAWHGADGQLVYFVAGELKLSYPDGTVEVIVGSCDAAALPLPHDLGRRASLRAITEVEFACIDGHLLDIMLTWDQLAAQAEARTDVAEPTRWRDLSGVFCLQNLTAGALAQLPPANIDALLRRFERVRVRAGEVVIREGEDGDWYYVIESGRCEVCRRVGGAEVPLAVLKEGEAFGEEALVAGGLRNATVTMQSPGTLLRLGKRDFIALLREPLLKRVSRAEAEWRAAGGAVWLDVRYPAEFQHNRLPGAINIPLNEIRHAIGPLDRGREYLVYCQSGRRSSAAAFILAQQGYRAVWLEGGLRVAADD